MKKAWPILPAALLVGTALYGTIASVRPPEPEPDRWVVAWKEAGLEASLRSTRGGRLILSGERRRLEEPAFEGTSLRDYWVEGILVQILELPAPDLFPEIEEGRHADFRPGDKGRRAHVLRKGRTLILVHQKIYAIGTSAKTVPMRTVRKILDGVEDRIEP